MGRYSLQERAPTGEIVAMNDANPAALAGITLGERYALEEVIGRGGMSAVYRARDPALGRTVAVKVIHYPSGSDELRQHLRERFRREAGAVARISGHPNVIHVYDYGTDPELDVDYIVMELLNGRDLRTALKSSALDSRERVRVLIETARGLAAGHRVGVVHRDVKPGNIFLAGQEKLESVRLLDFGIAKVVEGEEDDEDDLTQMGGVPHTPAYASPEQLDTGRPLTPASDVYQLGLVAYEVLAGERPFGEPERARIRSGEPIPLPVRGRWEQVPGSLRAVVERALQLDPQQRFPDGAAMAEALAQASQQGYTLPMGAIAADDDPTLYEPIGSPVRPAPTEPATSSRLAWWRARPTSPAIPVVVGGVLVALLLWGVLGARGDRSGDNLPGQRPPTPELEEMFAPLYRSAAARLAEEESALGEPEAAEVVRRVLADVNDAWVRGEMDRHLSHYADRVEFYGERRRRSEIRRIREETRSLYNDVEITLGRQEVEFPEPGRARAVVEKSWRFAGRTARRQGTARQELILHYDDGRWQIVSEHDLEANTEEEA